MKLDLNKDDIINIENLITSRINELRDEMSDDNDKEEELKEIIRYYKRLIDKIKGQI